MSSGSADLLLETLKKKLLQFKTNVNALNLEYERKQELLKEEKDKRDKVFYYLVWYFKRVKYSWLVLYFHF